MKPAPDTDRRLAIRDEAADWYLARQQGLDAAESRRFFLWMAESPEHLAEYHALEQLGRDLASIAASGLSAEELAVRARAVDEVGGPVVQLHGRRVHTGRRHIAFALAASVCIASLTAVLWLRERSAIVAPAMVNELKLESAHGQLLTQALQDGSVLNLDTDSAVVVRYGRDARRVTLVRGRAMFDVVHDQSRPFSVSAGDATVLDLGTKFDVYLQQDVMRVTVLEGRVVVSGAGASPGQILVGGQQMLLEGRGSAGRVSEIDADMETAYLRRLIVFEGRPLAAVVAEFNRYSATPILITTPQLASRMVSGSASVDDLATFIAYLRGLPGVHVDISADRILVSQT